jgi:hypothetical protein
MSRVLQNMKFFLDKHNNLRHLRSIIRTMI